MPLFGGKKKGQRFILHSLDFSILTMADSGSDGLVLAWSARDTHIIIALPPSLAQTVSLGYWERAAIIERAGWVGKWD